MAYKEDAYKYRVLVNEALDAYMACCDAPKGLSDAMRYSLDAGGKRLRPCMTLAACDMLGGDVHAALPFACALEMIHTYSLIHDDLPCMDNDDFRRGKPSNHKIFGEANAVLSGDGLLSYAFDVMLEAVAKCGTQNSINAARAVSRGAGVCGMVAGQFIDLACENDKSAGEAELHFIHLNKTAAMIKAALLAGAHTSGAGRNELAALARFGDLYGLLFQITDDILDIEGCFEDMGKTLGKDISENKLTYPGVIGLDNAKQMAANTAKDAQMALSIFKEKAAYFCELTTLTLCRRS